jgi:sporulation integral membrane protein YlbJ
MPNRVLSFIWGGIAAVMLLAFLFYPKIVIEASLRGISIWWDVLFPALLPFFVISDLMLGIGVVHFAGTLLDPLMRPLFRISGRGGFVMAMGFVAGYPVGARLAAQLRAKQELKRDEGERLVAFTTTADPIFLIGAVSIGFFHDPALALVLAVAHYLGAVIVGGIMRFHGKEAPTDMGEKNDKRNLLVRAIDAMRRAREEDARPFGQMFAEAVESALRLVFVVGGLVVFFCVFIDLLQKLGAIQWISSAAAIFLTLIGSDPGLAEALVNGLFEVTIGAQAASLAEVSYPQRAIVAAFVLSWAGLSVHAQVVSLLTNTGFRYWPFLFARLLHALISMLIVHLSWNALYPSAHAFTLRTAFHDTVTTALYEQSPFAFFFLMSAALSLLMAIVTLLSMFAAWIIKVVQRPGGQKHAK